MKSVAIVGFSKKTLPYVKYSHANEYWTMNHVFLTRAKTLKKIDRLYELHKREWYLRGEQTKSKRYDKWLRKPHPFPIYMQEKEVNKELVPSSVRYPYEEICEALLPGLIKMDGKQEWPMNYFTSTVALMIAHAIYDGFDQIELYGVDMDSDTEYSYQKACGEFWIGYALGRGIKVITPEKSTLYAAPIYGYEVVPYIDKMYVKKFIERYQERQRHFQGKMDEASKILVNDPENTEAQDKWLENSAWFFMYEGAIRAGAILIKIDDSFISRQYIELAKPGYLQGMENNKGNVNTIKGQLELLNRENIPDELWRAYLNNRASMYGNDGALQLLSKLIKTIDGRPVGWELYMEIKEG